MQGLNWQTLQVPLAAGLAQKSDDRARQAPALSVALDVQFDESGGLQTRKPFATFGTSWGDNVVRRVVENGDELLLFTKDTLYSWNAQAATWVSKGTHLAVEVAEESRFVTTGDQINSDRAELGNTIVWAWEDTAKVYVAAIDKVTGAVKVAPIAVTGAASRPRLVALSTRVMLFFTDNLGGLYCYALDPANIATALGGASTTVLGGGNFNAYYDAVRIAGTDTAVVGCRRTVTTSYSIITVTAALVVTAAVKARVCDGPIAVSSSPTGLHVQVVRGNAGNIQGDLIAVAAFADTYTGQAIGTAGAAINQIAAAHRSVADGGQYRCYAFWSAGEASDSANFMTSSNWVDTGNNLGVEAAFVRRVGVASRAFDHEGRVFVHLAFAGESGIGLSAVGFRSAVQNTYFLYRDDAFLVAKIAATRAGGFAASTGRLPHVALVVGTTTSYAWAATERRVIPIGVKHNGYGARAPREVTITFDSDAARRCVRHGATLYITGGEILQYDGSELVEVGFHIYPWAINAVVVAAGNLANGSYAYRSTIRWDNARGERDRSTTATTALVTIAAGPDGVTLWELIPAYTTHKTASMRAMAVEVWRTKMNPADDGAPFYMVTSNDPAVVANPNRYVPNDPTADWLVDFTDELADADLTSEPSPENGALLENLAPPAATIIAATADRLFLAGVAGDPHRVWYSKLREEETVASFHDVLTVTVPREGGAITGLGFLQDILVVFKATAIYMLPGDGLDNLGEGQNYGPARILSSDVGAVNHESIALTPMGLVFKSSKGWYLLNRGWSLDYIGGPVADYDADTVVAVHVVEAQHQIRCLTSSRLLILDYLAKEWSEWTREGARSATIWQGKYVYCDTGQTYEQMTVFPVLPYAPVGIGSLEYGIDVETPWLKPELLGGISVRELQVLGEYVSACRVRIRIAYDYKAAWVDDKTWTPSPTVVGDGLQLRHGPSRPKCQALKVRITAMGAADTWPAGEAIKLTGLALEVGAKRGLYKRLPAAQKQ